MRKKIEISQIRTQYNDSKNMTHNMLHINYSQQENQKIYFFDETKIYINDSQQKET